MTAYMKTAVGSFDVPLGTEERNMLSVAFKQAVGARRTALRAVPNDAQDATMQPHFIAYRQKLQGELHTLCTDVINLITKLVPGAADVEAKVFYMKMQGDYYRYLAESTASEADCQNAAVAYEAAWGAGQGMAATHPVLLGLALNRSVFNFEVLRKPEDAKSIANQALQNATQAFGSAPPEQQAEARQIMELLSDNLNLWGAPATGGANDGTAA